MQNKLAHVTLTVLHVVVGVSLSKLHLDVVNEVCFAYLFVTEYHIYGRSFRVLERSCKQWGTSLEASQLYFKLLLALRASHTGSN